MTNRSKKSYIDFVKLIQQYNKKQNVIVVNNSQNNNQSQPKKNKKIAILVGVSDYKYISDLSFCDEDASSWYTFFKKRGYDIFVYGDTHINNYPIYSGLATEAIVRAKIKETINNLGQDDIMAFVTSGHGSGDGKGNSFLCMYDCNSSPEGSYTDKEFFGDIKNAKCKIFSFFDNCYSGGMLDELSKMNNIFATSTCNEKGFGYDDVRSKNGMWTQVFLEDTLYKLINDLTINLVYVFNNAVAKYPYSGNDRPIMSCSSKQFII